MSGIKAKECEILYEYVKITFDAEFDQNKDYLEFEDWYLYSTDDETGNVVLTFKSYGDCDFYLLKNIIEVFGKFEKNKSVIFCFYKESVDENIVILEIKKKYLLDIVLEHNHSLVANIGDCFKDVDISKFSHLGNEYGMFDQVKEMKYIKRYDG